MVQRGCSPRVSRSASRRVKAAKVCPDYVCCDQELPTSPCAVIEDCPDCVSSSSRQSSPCLDAHHLSSACTEPVCSAATSSATAICAATADCCDAAGCIDSPTSPCAESICEATSPCPVVAATCCSDTSCEPETEVCDGLVVADAHGISHTTCPDCRGSVSSKQVSQQGRMYNSFQELLDCCCCSIPPAADQCCVGDSETSQDHTVKYCSLAHDTTTRSADTADTVSSDSLSQIVPLSQINLDMEWARSRSSTVSTAFTPPLCTSPLPVPQFQGHRVSARRTLADLNEHLLPDVDASLQLWDDCNFDLPHLHNSQSECLPPVPAFSHTNYNANAPMPHTPWSQNNSIPFMKDARPQACQWAGCQQRFWTVEELVAHVNHDHLVRRVGDLSSAAGTMFESNSTAQSQDYRANSAQSLACLWRDCQEIPQLTESSLAIDPDGRAAGSLMVDDKLSFAMLQHLMHDHLGTQTNATAKLGPDPVAPASDIAGIQANEDTYASPAPGLKRRRCDSCSGGEGDDEDNDTLRCRWEGCNQPFSNHSQLTEHITQVHVGSGKNVYECRWAGCTRHAEGKTFAQKQKVLRHIQTHTGDRPFKCDLCGKRFSEPNTLAQHIRTHTQEKPYVCDFPGCGKAFAVAGSLTIHKRIHSGAKPFVCAYPGCHKAFAESSNLAKHMRTHSGHRPYECSECGKGFSRPDQLSRHRKTHERKSHHLTPIEL